MTVDSIGVNAKQANVYTVFIASPKDVLDERLEIRRVVENLNDLCATETEWRIELLGWEETFPGAGRPADARSISSVLSTSIKSLQPAGNSTPR